MKKINHIHKNQIFRNLAACLMIVVIFLTGCNGQNILETVFPDEGTITDQEIKQEDSQQDSILIQTLEPVESPPPVNKLLIWIPPQFDPYADTESGRLMLNQISSFKEMYPDVEVEIREKAENGPSSVFNTLIATSLVAPDALPSIVLIPQSSLEEAVGQGVVQPISGFSSVIEENDFYPFALEMAKKNEEIYGVPLAADAIGLISAANSMGSKYLSLLQTGEILDSIAFPMGDVNTLIPTMYYQSLGGTFADDQGNLIIEPEFMVEMLTAVEESGGTGIFSQSIVDYQSDDQLWNAFTNGDVENVITWTSRALEDPRDLYISPVPGIGDNPYTYARGWIWCLVDQTVYALDASTSFIEHMANPTFLSEWTPTTMYLPVRPSSIKGWEEPLQASINTIMESAVQIPDGKVLESLNSDIINAVQDVLLGRSTPEESTLALVEKIEELQTE